MAVKWGVNDCGYSARYFRQSTLSPSFSRSKRASNSRSSAALVTSPFQRAICNRVQQLAIARAGRQSEAAQVAAGQRGPSVAPITLVAGQLAAQRRSADDPERAARRFVRALQGGGDSGGRAALVGQGVPLGVEAGRAFQASAFGLPQRKARREGGHFRHSVAHRQQAPAGGDRIGGEGRFSCCCEARAGTSQPQEALPQYLTIRDEAGMQDW